MKLYQYAKNKLIPLANSILESSDQTGQQFPKVFCMLTPKLSFNTSLLKVWAKNPENTSTAADKKGFPS